MPPPAPTPAPLGPRAHGQITRTPPGTSVPGAYSSPEIWAPRFSRMPTFPHTLYPFSILVESLRHSPFLGTWECKAYFPDPSATKEMFPASYSFLFRAQILPNMGLPTQSLTCSLSPHTDGGTAGTPWAGPHSGGPGKALAESGEDKASRVRVRARVGEAPEDTVFLTQLWRLRGSGVSVSYPCLFSLAPAPPTTASASRHCGGLCSCRATPAPGCCPGPPRCPPRPSWSNFWPTPSWTHPSAPEPWGQPPTAEPPPQPTAGEIWGRGQLGA